TRLSTSAASPSCARRRMPSPASCAPTSIDSRWAASFSITAPSAPSTSASGRRWSRTGARSGSKRSGARMPSMTERIEARRAVSGEFAVGPAAEEAWSEEWVRRFLRCTRCDAPTLERRASDVACRTCGHTLAIVGPGLLEGLPDDPASTGDASAPLGGLDAIAQRVRRFYEENPFPNYDGYESVGDLLSR